VSGNRLVAERISELEVDMPVKRCLQELFTHELENADARMPRYTAEYEKAIARHAAAWDGEAASGGDAE
jgi:hypothetical protein